MALDPVGLVVDFVRAAREPAAVDALLPGGLGAVRAHQRLHVMVALGAVLTGVLCPEGERVADGPAERLADQLTALGATLDAEALRDLIALQCVAECRLTGAATLLVDVLAVLLTRFALSCPHHTSDSRPAAGRAAPSAIAPGGRPVPSTHEGEQR